LLPRRTGPKLPRIGSLAYKAKRWMQKLNELNPKAKPKVMWLSSGKPYQLGLIALIRPGVKATLIAMSVKTGLS
jgi:hypothetical protein